MAAKTLALAKVDALEEEADVPSGPRDGKGAKYRLTIAYPASIKPRIRDLASNMGVTTTTDVVTKSLQIAEWYFTAKAQGRRVLVENPDGGMIREVEFL